MTNEKIDKLYSRLLNVVVTTSIDYNMSSLEINSAILRVLDFPTSLKAKNSKAGRPKKKRVGRPKGSKNKKK